MNVSFGRAMLAAASVLVVATLLVALWTMESPSKQRDRRLDQRRAADLGQIETALGAWHAEHRRLPASLAELASQPGLWLDTTDPVSGQAYAYAVTSARAYRLCAVFATSTADQDPDANVNRWQEPGWLHPAGRHCFERSTEPDKAAAQAQPPTVTP